MFSEKHGLNAALTSSWKSLKQQQLPAFLWTAGKKIYMAINISNRM